MRTLQIMLGRQFYLLPSKWDVIAKVMVNIACQDSLLMASLLSNLDLYHTQFILF